MDIYHLYRYNEKGCFLGLDPPPSPPHTHRHKLQSSGTMTDKFILEENIPVPNKL